jgi:hypothetical protein
MRKSVLAATLSVLSMQMFFLVSDVAHASGEEVQSPEYIKALAERYADGNPTESDESFISQHPEIGEYLVDARKTTTGIITNDDAAVTIQSYSLASASASVRCHRADRYLNSESTAGVRLFSYHTVVDWCENGRSVTKSSFHDYFDNINALSMQNPTTGRVHELIKKKRYWNAYTGGSIDVCFVKYGCIQTVYPAQQILHSAGKGGTTYQFYNMGQVGNGWEHEAGENPFTY